MRISSIAAIGENRELGKGNELVWRIENDLKRVREITMGHPLIMGRKTYESIGRPLPGRTNIVITRDESYTAEGCVIVGSIDKAIEKAREIEDEEVFIFGGALIYEQTIDRVDRLYLTLVHDTEPEADAFFPAYEAFTKVISKEECEQDGLRYDMLVLERE